MNYRIETKETFQVIGRTIRTTTACEGIGEAWSDWNSTCMFDKFHGRYAKGEAHDMCVSMSTDKTDEFYYTIGFLYNGAANVDGFNIVTVPGGKYVVFPMPDEVRNNVGDFLGRVYTEYLPSLNYKPNGVDAEYFPASGKWEAWFLVK